MFRVKLRIKSVKPHYPFKAAPALGFGVGKQVASDPDLLRRLLVAGAQGCRNYNFGNQRNQLNVSSLNNFADLRSGT